MYFPKTLFYKEEKRFLIDSYRLAKVRGITDTRIKNKEKL